MYADDRHARLNSWLKPFVLMHVVLAFLRSNLLIERKTEQLSIKATRPGSRMLRQEASAFLRLSSDSIAQAGCSTLGLMPFRCSFLKVASKMSAFDN